MTCECCILWVGSCLGCQSRSRPLDYWAPDGLAADLVFARHSELDGDQYWLLTPSAEVLEQSNPLAATLIQRSMTDFSLDRVKSKRSGHAACRLQTCLYLAKRIDAQHPRGLDRGGLKRAPGWLTAMVGHSHTPCAFMASSAALSR